MKQVLGNLRMKLSQCLWVPRTLFLAALLLPALSVQAQTAISTALTSSANPSTAGQSITLTATVTGSSPTGTVTFKYGAATGVNN